MLAGVKGSCQGLGCVCSSCIVSCSVGQGLCHRWVGSATAGGCIARAGSFSNLVWGWLRFTWCTLLRLLLQGWGHRYESLQCRRYIQCQKLVANNLHVLVSTSISRPDEWDCFKIKSLPSNHNGKFFSSIVLSSPPDYVLFAASRKF